MPSLITHWSLNPFKRRKTCLSRPTKLSFSYITYSRQQVNESIQLVSCTKLYGHFGRSGAWSRLVSLAHSTCTVTMNWSKLRQSHRDSWVSEHTVVVNMSHTVTRDLWRKDEIPGRQGSDRSVHPSTCWVCHALQLLLLRPPNVLCGTAEWFELLHIMWELLKRLHSSLTSLFPVRLGGSVHEEKPCVRNPTDFMHKPNTTYCY